MKVIAKKNRELALINAQNTQNENRAETITLVVPEEYEDYNKKIVFTTSDGNVWDIITNNEYKITNAITKYKQVDFYIWLTKEVDGESIDFRTKTKTLNFYHNEDASDEITDEEIHGVNTVVNLLEEEIEKVENLNIEATKIGSTTRVTITKKDGTTESVEINDGTDGQDGYTPQRGIDYFTEQDIEEIETDVKNDLEENVLVNYSLIAETGAKIELSINTTDYKLKAILKDKNNNIIHTSNVIDLPLETMVVNATYDNLNKAIILTLQNGTTVSISVADLVSGLVSESQLQTILSNYYTKTEINNLLNNKVDKVQGKELSSNDFTDVLKEKLEGLENYDDTEIKADISDIQTENARFKATLPTTTGEGQDITLDKTAELEFIKPPLPMGNSEQVTNLSDGKIEQGALSEGTPVTANDRIRTVNFIEVKEDTEISVNATSSKTIQVLYAFYDNSKAFISNSGWNNTGTNIAIINTAKYIKVVIKNSDGTNISPNDVSNFVVGNIPNPDYPQEITNVTGDVEVKVQNKNIAHDITYVSQTNQYYYLVLVSYTAKKDKIYTISFDTENTGISCYLNLVDASKLQKITSNTNFTMDGQKHSFVVKALEDVEVSNISLVARAQATSTTGSGYLSNFQIEEGTTVTNYVEHKSQTFTFPLGNEKLMLGDYLADDGIHHVRGQVVFDGTENWLAYATGNTENYNCFTIRLETPFKKSNNQYLLINAFSNYFKEVAWIYIYSPSLKQDKPGFGFTIDNNKYAYIKVKNTISTAQDLKTWLAQKYANNSPVIIEYPLNEEVIVPYTSAQQEVYNQIKQALSYEEQTNISSNTIALFNVEAYQDAKVILAEKGTYSKPSTGIPKTDLASDVQTSLGKADTAIQSHQDISGKANKISVVQTSASTIEIDSNTFYKFGEVASLNITLASITDNTIYNEYMFEFVSGTTATTLTLPSSIKWLETPTIDANKIYQCSIVDNVGLLVGVANV